MLKLHVGSIIAYVTLFIYIASQLLFAILGANSVYIMLLYNFTMYHKLVIFITHKSQVHPYEDYMQRTSNMDRWSCS